MRAMNEMVLREVAGEHILIPVGKTAMRVKGMISLSESGSLLWQDKLIIPYTMTNGGIDIGERTHG